MSPHKLPFANLPTPLIRYASLDALCGAEVWVKRDDMTGGPETGNKIRKLEYLLAEAKQHEAHVVITCGGIQSNHARATALLAAQLGMRCILLLRRQQEPDTPPSGNLLLDRLVGAEIRFITPEAYPQRDHHMAEIAGQCEADGQRAYVIPEGGSNGRGALGYVEAMNELAAQMASAGLTTPFDVLATPCGFWTGR